jgi:hypothetical protein
MNLRENILFVLRERFSNRKMIVINESKTTAATSIAIFPSLWNEKDDIEIVQEGDEITVYYDRKHRHINAYGLDSESAAKQIAEDVANYLVDLFILRDNKVK